MTTAILIPARYNSSRFPGKMMEKLNGVPLVEHVYNICAATGLDTYVLTDHQDIYNYMGAKRCLMTQDAENTQQRQSTLVLKSKSYIWRPSLGHIWIQQRSKGNV